MLASTRGGGGETACGCGGVMGGGPLRSPELGGGGRRGDPRQPPGGSRSLTQLPLRPLGFSPVRGKGAGSRGVPLTAAEEADRLTDT